MIPITSETDCRVLKFKILIFDVFCVMLCLIEQIDFSIMFIAHFCAINATKNCAKTVSKIMRTILTSVHHRPQSSRFKHDHMKGF